MSLPIQGHDIAKVQVHAHEIWAPRHQELDCSYPAVESTARPSRRAMYLAKKLSSADFAQAFR